MAFTDSLNAQLAIETEAADYAESLYQALLGSVNTAFDNSSREAVLEDLRALARLDLLDSQAAIERLGLEFSQLGADALNNDLRITRRQLDAAVSINGNVRDMASRVSRDSLDRITRAAASLFAEDASVEEVRKAIVGTSELNFRDGQLSQIRAANEATFKTAQKLAFETGQNIARQEDPEVIGYQWVSVLDSRTCIEESQLVSMADGSKKQIKDIVEGEKIITHLGNKRLVIASEKTGEMECFEVTFEDGRVLVCTEDHKVWTGSEWVAVIDLPRVQEQSN